MRVLAIVFALLLSGCGGSSDASAPKTTPAKKTMPTIAVPSGKPVPAALSSFRCAPDKKGRWNASGYLTNASKGKVTYQVTVYVGEAAGGEENARTKQVSSVAPGGSVKFAIRRVPAPKGGGPCHVQVLAGG